MKTINVPAQITTVEDKVAGNLTLIQMTLMICPVFIDLAFCAILPKPFNLNTYKLLLIFFVSVLFLLSAIRFKEKIVLLWFVTLTRYLLRPRYYVFDKNTSYLRNEKTKQEIEEHEESEDKPTIKTLPVRREYINKTIPRNMSFNLASKRKGKLNVYITEAN